MTRVFWAITLWLAVFVGGMAKAQDTWVQVEARSSLSEALDRAQAYASAFPNVSGYKLSSGWYAIVLGPFAPDQALQQLDLLRNERLIPADSYIANSGKFGQRFWPAGADATAPDLSGGTVSPAIDPAQTPDATGDASDTPDLATDLAASLAPAETPAESRAAEAGLSSDERMDVQRAMQFFGTYSGKIDGSFGPGTRASMKAWQENNSYEDTGVLTTVQRTTLLNRWNEERAALGLTPVSETEAGIDIELPLGLVTFDRYDPPFVRYKAKDGSGYEILLISRQGDAKTLVALFDRLQALTLIPMTGERSMAAASFTINGLDDQNAAFATATMSRGLIKGYVLVWPTKDATRAARILDTMKSSFVAQGSEALDENLGQPSATASADLVSGLEVRRPTISRSGVYIDASGSVLTTTEVLDQCTRLTLDEVHPAQIAYRDDQLGLVVLRPETPLAPPAVAELQPILPRKDSAVVVAGYSYEDQLDAPVVSFGTLADDKGLEGEANLARLTISTLPGDAGGAVLDSAGAMMGMLLPRKQDSSRQLPDDVSFALNASTIEAALAKAGVTAEPSTRTGSLAAEDLGALGRSMTVLVSCWK
jgi:peptidoglycan hydrolase-like protein with peptidoglycan-binding domain